MQLEPLIEIVIAAGPGRVRAVERFEARPKNRVGLALRLHRRHAPFQPAEHLQPHHLVGRPVVEPVHARQHERRRVQRQPDVRLLSRRLADETARRHADDRRAAAPHGQALAEHVGAAAEAPLPVAVADDGARRGGAAVRGREDAAQEGALLEQRERRGGDVGGGHALRRPAFVGDDCGGSGVRGETTEALGCPPPVVERRRR